MYHLDNQCTGNGETNPEYFILDHMACNNKLLLICKDIVFLSREGIKQNEQDGIKISNS